jgi:hypothetical protein
VATPFKESWPADSRKIGAKKLVNRFSCGWAVEAQELKGKNDAPNGRKIIHGPMLDSVRRDSRLAA